MKKEYITITEVRRDEKNDVIDTQEVVVTELIADEGKIFHCKPTGFTGGTRITLGTNDSEENYEEVDDPNYAIDADELNEAYRIGVQEA